jgi:hypothetical protein
MGELQYCRGSRGGEIASCSANAGKSCLDVDTLHA